MSIDLSALSYDNWLNFVFDHPIHEPLWHLSDEWQYEVSSPERVLDYVTKLFTNPAVLIQRFSLPHIEQGFWFLPSQNGLMWLVLVPSIPWPQRYAAIHSIASLFETFFSQVELNTSIYMWWDSFISYCAWEDRDAVTDRNVLKEIVAVMAQLNANPSARVRQSVQHGVEHLRAIASKESDDELAAMLKSSGLVGSTN